MKKKIAARADSSEDDDEDDDLRAQEAEKLLNDINECKVKNNGKQLPFNCSCLNNHSEQYLCCK